MSYKLEPMEREKIITALQFNNTNWQVSAKHTLMEKNSTQFFTLFENGLTDSQLIEYMLYKNYKSIVQNSFQPATEKLKLIKRLSISRNQFFNLEFNLLEEGAKTATLTFGRQTSREEIQAEVCDFIGMSAESTRASKVLQTIEELLMNVQVTSANTKTAAGQALSYLKLECSDNLIAISAFDDCGSLDSKKFLKKIESGLSLGLDKSINFGKGGAGLGSSYIFKNCDSLFLGVNTSKKTRVSVIMPYNVTERKFDGLQRSVHIIDIK